MCPGRPLICWPTFVLTRPATLLVAACERPVSARARFDVLNPPAMTISAPPQQPAEPIMAQALKDLEQSLAQALQLAVAHQQSGQFEEAETLYRSILHTQPNHPDANHSLGVLAVQMKQAEAGLPYFAAALEARPEPVSYTHLRAHETDSYLV